ncbi:hypothetical protein HK104_002409 [Borealophlyctis nickersoniae]|nr:hypothetical protein HK104_002409 [Borealophlyctis nickersoniae]
MNPALTASAPLFPKTGGFVTFTLEFLLSEKGYTAFRETLRAMREPMTAGMRWRCLLYEDVLAELNSLDSRSKTVQTVELETLSEEEKTKYACAIMLTSLYRCYRVRHGVELIRVVPKRDILHYLRAMEAVGRRLRWDPIAGEEVTFMMAAWQQQWCKSRRHFVVVRDVGQNFRQENGVECVDYAEFQRSFIPGEGSPTVE